HCLARIGFRHERPASFDFFRAEDLGRLETQNLARASPYVTLERFVDEAVTPLPVDDDDRRRKSVCDGPQNLVLMGVRLARVGGDWRKASSLDVTGRQCVDTGAPSRAQPRVDVPSRWQPDSPSGRPSQQVRSEE